MKLIVTVPAYNETETLPKVIKSIPKKIKGIDEVKVLVWDDGSTDNTFESAKKAGADYVFKNKKNLGLAKTFNLATKKAVELGADIVVNTDADNQYDQAEIPKLIAPILEKGAEMVNGDRQVSTLDHMPASKKYGNIIGSWVIRQLTGVKLNDASSGFRAYTAETIKKFHIYSSHTYTHETIIQAAFGDVFIHEVPVTFKERPGGSHNSRLISSVWSHIKKSAATIIRTILMYKSLKFFGILGSVITALGFFGIFRFIYFYFQGSGNGHIQSLVISSVLISFGLTTLMVGVLADLISINRRLLEEK